MATGRATRDLFLSEAGFEKVFHTQFVGASCFVDDFVSYGASGVHMACCLNPLEVGFRPTPDGSRQVVYPDSQLHFANSPELMQWQHHHDDNVHLKKELGWIDTIELSPCKATRKPTKTTTEPKDTQNTETTTKPNKTPNNHGTVGDQLVSEVELKRIREDDNIVSPIRLVWQTSTRQTEITKKPYRNL